MDFRATQEFLNQRYEGAVMGTTLGAGVTAYNSSSTGATVGIGLAVVLPGMAVDAMVEDVNFIMVTDIQISEKMGEINKIQ